MRAARPVTTGGQLSLGEARLEYQTHDCGNEHVPAIVLLHEGLGCVAMWKDFPQSLSATSGAKVITYSRAGYGASSACALPRPLDYMQVEGEQVLPQVLSAIDARRCVLLGHSDGASIAAVCAATHSGPPIEGLILVAPHFFTEEPGLRAIRQARFAFENQGLRERLRKYHGENVDCAFRGWNDAWLHADFRAWDITHYLPRIKVPVLAIQGEQDQYGSEAQLNALSEHCAGPLEILTLPDCAHSPFSEQPRRTLEAICRWFAALSTSGRASDRDQIPGVTAAHNDNSTAVIAPEGFT